MKKKVLFLIDSLGCGGAEKSLVSLLPLLDYSRMSVDLLVVRRGGVFEKYVPSNVHFISFPTRKNLAAWKRVCQVVFSVMIRLRRNRHGAELLWTAMSSTFPKLKKEYDVAIAYQQGFPTYYVAEKVKAAKKCAWINVEMRKAGYKPWFNRRFYDKMTKVIAVSDTLLEMLRHDVYADQDKLFMVRDIVNVDLVTRMSLEHGFDGNDANAKTLRIVTVGRLTIPKNYLLAVETAKLLKEKGLSFRWYFVGEGGERLAIEKKIAEYGLQQEVKLLGLQANPYPYMRQCDIYVQTSNFEGFGLTISEAMILHKPIVSTNFTVIRDQIEDGINGLISEMTSDSLCRKIMSLALDERLRQKIVEGTYCVKNNTATTESVKVNTLILE